MTHAQSVSFLLSEAIGKTGEFLADHKNLCYAAAFMSAERCQQILGSDTNADPEQLAAMLHAIAGYAASQGEEYEREYTRQLGVELSAARKARQRQKKGDGA